MKASVYLRISSDRSGERAGVDRQREDCVRRVAERGWELVRVHEDNDLSAHSGRRRPGFEALLADIETGQANVVVAWALDRLQRNRRDELRLWEACQEHNVILSLVNGADLDFSTAAGRFVADGLSSAARLEVELKSDRQKRAALQRAKAGKRNGGRRPFGYNDDGVTVRESEARYVRAMYDRHLSGVPLGSIATWLNDEGVPTTQARYGKRKGEPTRWTHATVRSVLMNARNAGLRSHKGEIMGTAEWPALVSEETYRAVLDILEGRRHGIVRASQNLLTGIAVCGVCGATAHAGGNTRAGVRGYRCSSTNAHFSRMADPIDEAVGQYVVARLSRDDARDLLTDSSRVPDPQDLRTEASSLRARLEGVAVEFADGALTAAQLRAITERLRGRLDDVEHQLADQGRVDVLGPLVDAPDMQEAWQSLTIGQRRAVVDMLLTVTIHPVGRGVRTFRADSITVEFRA